MIRHEQFHECRPSRGFDLTDAPALSSRLPIFVGSRLDTEAALKSLRVGIVGIGSVGMRIAEHLARLRIGGLWLVDPRKSSKPESLLTHPISRLTNLPKATYMAQLCKRISPATRVFTHVGHVQDLWLDTFADTHLCVMATDNLAAEVDLGQRCLWLGKRLVHAALHGETLTAQVRVFANANSECPCPACAFGPEEWRQLFDQVQYSCEGAGHATMRITGPPTRSTSHLCALAADLAVNQILRLVLQLGQDVGDTIEQYCGFTGQVVTSRLARNPNCRCDHRPFSIRRAALPLKSYSFARLVRDFATTSHTAPTLSIGGAEWVEKGICRCAEPAVVQRFISTGKGLAGRCARCQSVIHTQPTYTYRAVSDSTLGKAANLPLCFLGVRSTPWTLLRFDEQTILIQNPARTPSLP